MGDWQPKQYLKFRNQRTQPTIDLVQRIGITPTRIIDIGSGPGNSTAILKERWPQAEVYGLDSSPAMIEKARADYPDINWIERDADGDLSDLGSFDLVFSNAALQWIPNHEELIPKLYSLLAPGGVLAVQVSDVKRLPVYSVIHDIMDIPEWRQYFATPPEYPKHFDFHHYYRLISKLPGKVDIWQTDYIHVMDSHDGIVEWYKGTGLRPFLNLLPNDRSREIFCQEYGRRIAKAYQPEENGKVLLPFTRIFFMVEK